MPEMGDVFESIMSGAYKNDATLLAHSLCLLRDLERLHDNDVVHRDIKPENILVNENVLYIADFGFSVKITKVEPTIVNNSGTVVYAAPELFTHINTSVLCKKDMIGHDIWAATMTILVMSTGLVPFGQSGAGIVDDTTAYSRYKCMRDELCNASLEKDIHRARKTIVEVLCLQGKEYMLDFFILGLDPDPSTRTSLDYLISKLEEISHDFVHPE
jgi:serine/threonine protein kinase